MNATTTCTYSNKVCGFGSCTLPTHIWQWGSSTCSYVQTGGENVQLSLVEETPTTTTNYYVISSFFSLLISFVVILVGMTYIVKKLV